jgi:hypothetical protein
MTILSAHQPVYLPGLILFNKIALSDVFVFLCDVQFKRRSWHVRNQVRNGESAIWLTVAAEKSAGHSNTIRQVGFGDTEWRRKHLASLEHEYRKRPYFADYFDDFAQIICSEFDNLAELNMALTRHFCAVLQIHTTLLDSKNLDHSGINQDRLISLCHAVKADHYVSNIGSAAYVDESGFENEGVTHSWQAFSPPVYDQGKPFLANLSVIDALFNLGPQTAEIVKHAGHLTPDLEEAQFAMRAEG